MKKSITFVAVLLLTLVLAGTALAGALLMADVYTSLSPDPDANNNGAGILSARSSGISCVVNNEIFLMFDLSGVTGVVSNDTVDSTMDFSVVFQDSAGNGNLELWSLTDDSWTETGITHNNKPVPTALLASLSLPLAQGSHSFSSAALVTYLNQESAYTGSGDPDAGDNKASFVIRIGNCGINSSIFLHETGGQFDGNPVTLQLFNPTAVQLTTLQASSGISSTMILTVSAIIGLVLVAGAYLFIKRKPA